MISQITPEGLSPARRAMSTAASVWPGADQHAALARDEREDRGPGLTMSSGPLAGVDRDRDGRARSAALMPVVTPFARLDRGGERGLHPAAVGAAHRLQARAPRRAAGEREADQPAAVRGHEVDRVGRRHLRRDDRSPSFSRSSSSTSTNIRPLRASSMIASIGTSTGVS
jgi:hypothetical protein